eukprot:scaffold19902_cov45-Phaeocystis_antarctica.AAC.1
MASPPQWRRYMNRVEEALEGARRCQHETGCVRERWCGSVRGGARRVVAARAARPPWVPCTTSNQHGQAVWCRSPVALWGGVSPCALVSEATASVSNNAIVQQQLWHPCNPGVHQGNPLCNPTASNSAVRTPRNCERCYLVVTKKPRMRQKCPRQTRNRLE